VSSQPQSNARKKTTSKRRMDAPEVALVLKEPLRRPKSARIIGTFLQCFKNARASFSCPKYP
jgi:hypothetical protein